MSSKLVLKHKDSLALKESKAKREEKQEVNKQTGMRYGYLRLLPCLTLSVFLVYWLVLCPLIFTLYFFTFKTAHPSPFESFVYWIIALAIWLVITCAILTCWRRSQAQRNSEISATSKYGSDSVDRPLGVPRASYGDAESLGTKKTVDSRDPESKRNDREGKKDLPPLVIHKRASGEDVEDTAIVHTERDEEACLNVASDYVAKSPLQDYLQLVTVSPSEEGEVKSPKTPMSPRELFFIDLIRGAEEADRANSSEPRTRFFPSETTGSDTKDQKLPKNAEEREKENTEDRKDAKDAVNSGREGNRISDEKTKRESSYFIADVVESPVSEKSEVFLHIDPNTAGDPTEVVVEKPVLLLQSNENSSQAN